MAKPVKFETRDDYVVHLSALYDSAYLQCANSKDREQRKQVNAAYNALNKLIAKIPGLE